MMLRLRSANDRKSRELNSICLLTQTVSCLEEDRIGLRLNFQKLAKK